MRISHLELPTPVGAIGFVVRWTVLSYASLGLAHTARAINDRK